ncbi:hypothetical protein AB1Y20_021008 [Prymnesium parvum]|uniref:RING-type domain-containing protein n=1 Tax=Prymnesium parvum TaxID=97485 RepID=A0AB34JKV7_PRYPA
MDPPGLRALSAPAVVKRVFILVNMACYLVFCHLMMAKLELLESYYRTGANSTEMTTANSCVGECSPQWMAVFLPIWIADLLNVVMHLAFFYVRLAWTPTTSMHNARIEHITGLCRSLLYALFKLLLVKQLQIVAAPPGTSNNPQAVAWWVVFWPTYLAAFLQLVLHLRKHLEPSPAHRSPPRRPGFSISVFDLLAINISCKLEDAFYIPHASWASVLWPLWVAAAFGAIAIFLGICLALPLLRRQVSTAQIAFVMPPVVLLVASYTFGLQGLTALTGWLDGDKSIRVFAIAQPIASAGWSLTLLLTIVAISSLFHPMAVVEHQDMPRQGLFSLDPSMLPRLMVMESSTLFRQVSSRTLERYTNLAENGAPDRAVHIEVGKKPIGNESPSGDGSDTDNSQSCWVCFEPPTSQAVLLQCGHAGLCLACAENLWRSRASCPMCRQRIDLIARFGETITVDGKIYVSPTLPKPSDVAENTR